MPIPISPLAGQRFTLRGPTRSGRQGVNSAIRPWRPFDDVLTPPDPEPPDPGTGEIVTEDPRWEPPIPPPLRPPPGHMPPPYEDDPYWDEEPPDYFYYKGGEVKPYEGLPDFEDQTVAVDPQWVHYLRDLGVQAPGHYHRTYNDGKSFEEHDYEDLGYDWYSNAFEKAARDRIASKGGKGKASRARASSMQSTLNDIRETQGGMRRRFGSIGKKIQPKIADFLYDRRDPFEEAATIRIGGVR